MDTPRQLEKKFKLPHGYFGVKGYEETPEHLLGAIIPVLPAPRHTFAELKIQYNQPDVSPVSCTEHGNIGCLSDLSGYVYPLPVKQALWQLMEAHGAGPDGYWVNKASDDSKQDWNTRNPNDTVINPPVALASDDFIRVLNQGYSVAIAYYGNGTYNQDFMKDGVLDLTVFGVATYGHCVRLTKGDGATFNLIVDNYNTSAGYRNTYNIPMGHLPILVTNKVFSPTGYFYVFQNDLAAMAQTIPDWGTVAWAKGLKLGIVKTTDDCNRLLSAADIENLLFVTKVFNQKFGNISLLRMLVLLDRFNELGA